MNDDDHHDLISHTQSSCIPINVLIVPGSDYILTVDAKDDVGDAFQGFVDKKSGFLSLYTNAPVSSTQPIKISVTLPPDALMAVKNTNVGVVVVAGGFVSKELTLRNDPAEPTTRQGRYRCRGRRR